MSLGIIQPLTQKLQEYLNQDMAYGKYIKIPFMRYFYSQLTKLSVYLLSYILIHLSLTQEIAKLDVLTYWKESQHQK